MKKLRSWPTKLTLDRLAADGWTAQLVEHRIHGSVNSRDLFGFVDIVALRGVETLAVQATDHTNVSHRVRKIADAPAVGAVREAGWRIEVWGWRELADGTFTLRVVDVS